MKMLSRELDVFGVQNSSLDCKYIFGSHQYIDDLKL